MATTIQVSEELVKELRNMKMFEKETYEEVIWDLVEDSLELSKETRENIEKSRKEISQGKVHTLEEIEEKLNKNHV